MNNIILVGHDFTLKTHYKDCSTAVSYIKDDINVMKCLEIYKMIYSREEGIKLINEYFDTLEKIQKV